MYCESLSAFGRTAIDDRSQLIMGGDQRFAVRLAVVGQLGFLLEDLGQQQAIQLVVGAGVGADPFLQDLAGILATGQPFRASSAFS